MFFLGLYRVLKCTKQLSFDSPAETDLKRSPTSTKVFVSVPAEPYLFVYLVQFYLHFRPNLIF